MNFPFHLLSSLKDRLSSKRLSSLPDARAYVISKADANRNALANRRVTIPILKFSKDYIEMIPGGFEDLSPDR